MCKENKSYTAMNFSIRALYISMCARVLLFISRNGHIHFLYESHLMLMLIVIEIRGKKVKWKNVRR